MANTEFYADGTRPDDTGDGLSEANAKKTLAALAALGAGGGNRWNIKSSATYTITAAIAATLAGTVTDGPNVFEGYSATIGDLGTPPTITSATSAVNLFEVSASFLTFRNLKLTHTGATRGAGLFAKTANRTGITVDRCLIDGCLNGIDGDFVVGFAFQELVIRNSEIKHCTGSGASFPSGLILDSYIHDNAVDGWRRGQFTTGNAPLTIQNCRLSASGGKNIHWNRDLAGLLTVLDSAVRNATGEGLYLSNATAGVGLVLQNNLWYENTGTQISSAAKPIVLVQINNAFKAGAGGNRHANIAAGVGDITLTGDPCVDAANHNYALNDTAGGGAECQETGFPGVLFAGGTGYRSVGGLEPQDAGLGSSSGFVIGS